MSNDNLMFQRTMPTKVRCELPECKQASNHVYQTNVDGYLLTADKPDHLRTMLGRWEEKKAKGIKPGRPVRQEDIIADGDNIEDLE